MLKPSQKTLAMFWVLDSQWIIGERDRFAVPMKSFSSEIKIENKYLEKDEGLINPGEEIEMNFEIKTGTQSAEYKISINDEEYAINVFKPLDFENKKINIWKQIIIKFRLLWKTLKK